jgi:hypothetical protein
MSRGRESERVCVCVCVCVCERDRERERERRGGGEKSAFFFPLCSLRILSRKLKLDSQGKVKRKRNVVQGWEENNIFAA